MNNSLALIAKQLTAIWKELGLNQKISIVLSALVVIGGLLAIGLWSSRVDYAVLFGNLGDAEAGKVVAALDESKVPYRLRSGSILVPSDQVHRLRMQLVTKGIPGGGSAGFSLFDKPNFGISDFVQRVNYMRAIQGELSMTISKVDGIESAQVLLVMPENRLLVEYQKKPSASVFLKLRGNAPVSAGTVNAIRFLVANSVEGLVPGSVSVTDNLGNLLTDQSDSDPIGGSSATQLKQKKEYESYLAKQVESVFTVIMGGAGKVLVRVAVELDFTTTQLNTTKYDPEGQVLRSGTVTDEKIDNTIGNQVAGGLPAGVAATPIADTNTVSPINAAGSSRNNTLKKISQNQYDISQTITTQNNVPGRVKRISAAVFMPMRTTGSGTNVVERPRSTNEIEIIRNGVRAALGIQETSVETGRLMDELRIVEMVFNEDPAKIMEIQIERSDRQRYWWEIAQNSIFPALGLAVLFLFWRTLQRTSIEEIPIGIPVGAEEKKGENNSNRRRSETEEIDPFVITSEMMNKLVRENPTNMTHALRTWMMRSGEKVK
jgi:flagellar M-ring protein FliF